MAAVEVLGRICQWGNDHVHGSFSIFPIRCFHCFPDGLMGNL